MSTASATVQWPFIRTTRMSSFRAVRDVNTLYHPRGFHIPHKHSQPSPRPSSLPLGSKEAGGTNPRFLDTGLILNLMRPFVNRWSLLTHTAQCMTTGRSAAATQTRVRVSPATHLRVFFKLDAPSAAIIFISRLAD